MTPTQVSVQLTDATMEQIEYLKRCGFGTRTNIVRMAIQDRYQNEREERGDMNDEMVNIRVMAGSIETAHNGFLRDNRRVVEFTGHELGSLTSYDYDAGKGCLTDTRGATETLYKAQDGRLIVHVNDWSRWQGEPSIERLHEIQESDLETGGEYEALGRECGFRKLLTVDQALVD